MFIKSAVLAVSLALVLAVPAPARSQQYDEFTSESAQERFAWGQEYYPYYCNVPPPPEVRNLRFQDLNIFARGALAFATKQQIADYIETNCGQDSSVAAKYVNGN